MYLIHTYHLVNWLPKKTVVQLMSEIAIIWQRGHLHLRKCYLDTDTGVGL